MSQLTRRQLLTFDREAISETSTTIVDEVVPTPTPTTTTTIPPTPPPTQSPLVQSALALAAVITLAALWRARRMGDE